MAGRPVATVTCPAESGHPHKSSPAWTRKPLFPHVAGLRRDCGSHADLLEDPRAFSPAPCRRTRRNASARFSRTHRYNVSRPHSTPCRQADPKELRDFSTSKQGSCLPAQFLIGKRLNDTATLGDRSQDSASTWPAARDAGHTHLHSLIAGTLKQT